MCEPGFSILSVLVSNAVLVPVPPVGLILNVLGCRPWMLQNTNGVGERRHCVSLEQRFCDLEGGDLVEMSIEQDGRNSAGGLSTSAAPAQVAVNVNMASISIEVIHHEWKSGTTLTDQGST